MATNTASADVNGRAGDLPRLLGSAHLALAGLLNLATGIGLLWLSVSGTTAELLVGVLPAYVDPTTLVAASGLAVTLIDVVVPIVGALLLPLALGQLLGAKHAAEGHRWVLCVVVGAYGVVNPLAIPVSLVSVALLVIGRDGFRDRA